MPIFRLEGDDMSTAELITAELNENGERIGIEILNTSAFIQERSHH